jgi:hypothetical protein
MGFTKRPQLATSRLGHILSKASSTVDTYPLRTRGHDLQIRDGPAPLRWTAVSVACDGYRTSMNHGAGSGRWGKLRSKREFQRWETGPWSTPQPHKSFMGKGSMLCGDQSPIFSPSFQYLPKSRPPDSLTIDLFRAYWGLLDGCGSQQPGRIGSRNAVKPMGDSAFRI